MSDQIRLDHKSELLLLLSAMLFILLPFCDCAAAKRAFSFMSLLRFSISSFVGAIAGLPTVYTQKMGTATMRRRNPRSVARFESENIELELN